MEERTIFVISIMIPLFIFSFLRNLLDRKSSWIFIFLASLGIAVFGVIKMTIDDQNQSKYFPFFVPVYSIGLYRIVFLWFTKKMKRPPVNTALNWRPGLPYDVLFNISYGMLISVVPAIVLLILMGKIK